MRTTKPNPSSTIRVTAMDADTGKSKSLTLYETTPDEVVDFLRSAGERGDTENDTARTGEQSTKSASSKS